jgi:hypothetical protein
MTVIRECQRDLSSDDLYGLHKIVHLVNPKTDALATVSLRF